MAEPLETFAPMPMLDVRQCLGRALRLYLANVPWFAVAGLSYTCVELLGLVSTLGGAFLVGWVLLIPARMGVYAVADSVAAGQAPTLRTLLSGFRDRRAYKLGFWFTVLLFVSLALFILPGLLFLVAAAWAPVALQRRPELSAWDALRTSLALTREHLPISLVLGFCGVVLFLFGDGTLILGAVTMPLMVCIRAVFFEQIHDAR